MENNLNKMLEALSKSQKVIENLTKTQKIMAGLAKSQKISSGLNLPIEDEEPLALRIPARNFYLADYQYEILMRSIKEFEDTLDDDHEVAIQLASFGESIIMNVTDIGYSNPSLIHFYGYVDGKKAELIQHVSKLNFLLLAVPKSDPNRPARRIGFVITDNESEDDSESQE